MISVVLPAFNESDTLRATVRSIDAFLASRNEDYEITIVENGSTDNTSDIGRELVTQNPHVHFFHLEQADYGNALRRGFQESHGDIVVNFDVDFYDTDFLERAVVLIRDKRYARPSIIVGSKRTDGAHDERPFLRRCATFVFSTLLRFGFGLLVTDTHGIKAFHRASVAPYEQECRFGIDLFDTELILRCERAGLVVNEIPVDVKESRPARSGLISRIPRTLRGLVSMKLLFLKESFVRRTKRVHVKMQP